MSSEDLVVGGDVSESDSNKIHNEYDKRTMVASYLRKTRVGDEFVWGHNDMNLFAHTNGIRFKYLRMILRQLNAEGFIHVTSLGKAKGVSITFPSETAKPNNKHRSGSASAGANTEKNANMTVVELIEKLEQEVADMESQVAEKKRLLEVIQRAMRRSK